MSGQSKPEEPKLIHETAELVVINKPAGWLSIRGRGDETAPVLSDWVAERHGSSGKIWIVHRLDRETSGVILFARSEEAHREANSWFSGRKIRKKYECLAQGAPRMPMLRIQKAIEGHPCATQVEVAERYSSGFLARVTPVTGRRHQIRIHLALEGHPLFGDTQYGGLRDVRLRSGDILTVSRVALHASRLELPTGDVFEAPWPEDFRGWVSVLRKDAQS